MRRLIAWLRGIWIGGQSASQPAPVVRQRQRQPYIQLPCSACGRSVAHTRGGVAWKHLCPAVPAQASMAPEWQPQPDAPEVVS